MRNIKQILVTGAAGFIGSELVPLLLKEGFKVIAVDDLSKGLRSNLPEENGQFAFIKSDLRDRFAALRVVRDCDWVIHLANQAYGVAYGSKNHVSAFILNTQINSTVIEAVVKNSIPGLLAVSSSCVYSDEAPDMMTEDFGFKGEPEIANWGYGWAKRMMEIGILAAVKDGKCEGIVARPVNIYGPNYGWFGEDSHVIPSLVRRILDGENPLIIWGNGTQARSFMHVKDAARALLDISLRAPSGTVVNLGDEYAISINEIAQLLRDIFNVDFEVKYDLTRPTGRKVKSVSSRLLKKILPEFKPNIPLKEGLKEMKQWYQRHKSLGNL
jgi:nucleoside-diphosphate-sugar epimerase